jgi:hypothetical protein
MTDNNDKGQQTTITMTMTTYDINDGNNDNSKREGGG